MIRVELSTVEQGLVRFAPSKVKVLVLKKSSVELDSERVEKKLNSRKLNMCMQINEDKDTNRS